jgi:lipid-binding SYLF domain-containing protein
MLLVVCQVSACTGRKGAPTGETAQIKEREARASLERLYQQSSEAKRLSSRAAGILVFPEITKAGFVVGGQYGDGVLFKHGRFAGFYNSTSVSAGLQAGAQQLGYALFFMSENDLNYLNRSKGWEIGSNPNLTIIDRGYSAALTSTTAREGVYAFFFDQKGLMAGVGLQGTKITKRG